MLLRSSHAPLRPRPGHVSSIGHRSIVFLAAVTCWHRAAAFLACPSLASSRPFPSISPSPSALLPTTPLQRMTPRILPGLLRVAAGCQTGGQGEQRGETGKETPQNVVICGGGIQGAAIAHYLGLRGVSCTIVERCEVAGAASGKAGGFLARNWGAGPTRQLHEVSFDLHAELAEDLNLQGYRKLPTLSVSPAPPGSKSLGGPGSTALPDWLDRDLAKASLLEDPGLVRRSMQHWDTAQTSPKELTQSLLSSAAKTAGLRVVSGQVEGVVLEDSQGEQVVTGVVVDGAVLGADCLVIAMGPWSCVAEDWFPQLTLPMQGIASTSIVYRSQAPVDPCAVFCKEDDRGCSLEIYPRPCTQAHGEQEVYVSGVGGSRYVSKQQLKGMTSQEQQLLEADPSRVVAAHQSFQELSSIGDTGPHTTQACMRPCPPDGLPYIGRLRGTSNAYLAAGHNCWGVFDFCVNGTRMWLHFADGESRHPMGACHGESHQRIDARRRCLVR